MFYVYVLRSETNNKYYIGCTNNIDRRITEHNTGKSLYTKNKGPWKLMYTEQFDNLSNAMQREKQIKSWKKRSAIDKLINAAFV